MLANCGVLNPNLPSAFVYHIRFSRYTNLALSIETASLCAWS